jgi:hypothetical protein
MSNVFNINEFAAGRVLPTLPGAAGRVLINPNQTTAAGATDATTQNQPSNVGGNTIATVNNANNTPVGTTVVLPSNGKTDMFGNAQSQPLEIGVNEKSLWLLPIEPLISISGGHLLIRRNVAKKKFRGSVKERWSQDDYTITINGMLRGSDDAEYPNADFDKLANLLHSNTVLHVYSPILYRLGITKIAIEKFEIPFTKGQNMQAFSITAYSDDDFKLLIESAANVL